VDAALTQARQRFLAQNDRQYGNAFVAREAVSFELSDLFF
jgi:hypothetical protein